jgi:transposase-like protein
MPTAEKMTVKEFFARFPDDDACLAHVMEVRFGLRHDCRKCGTVEATFHKIAGRKAYACAHCGDHVYPCAGTIFQDSRTSLQSWFYAIYLFVVTRHGVSGKELERALGVTYKTAWRMGQQIRKLMANADEFEMMQGHVESDEAYIGGVASNKFGRGRGAANKTVVMGIKEREGRITAFPIPNLKMPTIRNALLNVVEPGATVSTDEFLSYGLLERDGYKHGRVNHSRKEYARRDGDVVHHVNHVESFWRLFKKSIAGTHVHVSPKYMQRYLSEFTYRQNHREQRNAMFDLLIAAV